MKPYEITYLIVPSLTIEEASEYHERMKNVIEEAGGTPGKEQVPSKKSLAYPVEKNPEAYLASLDFEAREEDIKKISEKLKKEKNMLRYLLVKKEVPKKAEEKKGDSQEKKKGKSLKPEKAEKEKSEESEKTDKAKLDDLDEKIDEML